MPLKVAHPFVGLVKHEDNLYACGGFNNGILKSMEKFNSTSKSWEMCASMNAPKILFGIIST